MPLNRWMMIPWSTCNGSNPWIISQEYIYIYTLCISAYLMQTVPHIHLVATERRNQPERVKYKMGTSCNASPFITFICWTRSGFCEFMSFCEFHHWLCWKSFARCSSQYPLLGLSCSFELPWFDFQKTILWAGTAVTSSCDVFVF